MGSHSKEEDVAEFKGTHIDITYGLCAANPILSSFENARSGSRQGGFIETRFNSLCTQSHL